MFHFAAEPSTDYNDLISTEAITLFVNDHDTYYEEQYKHPMFEEKIVSGKISIYYFVYNNFVGRESQTIRKAKSTGPNSQPNWFYSDHSNNNIIKYKNPLRIPIEADVKCISKTYSVADFTV